MMDFALEVQAELELCADPRMIAEADDEIDRVLAEREMGVASLIEDELLLAIPIAPKHPQCDLKLPDSPAAAVSPFAGLAALKGRRR